MIATQAQRATELGGQTIDIKLRRYSLDDWPDIPAPLMERMLALVEETETDLCP